MGTTFSTVDEYVESFAPEQRTMLQRVRGAIHDGMPGAAEKIRYGMPAVMIADRYGLHFAGWKKHVGLYPVPRFDGDLELQIGPYRKAKDSVAFPYTAPIPYDLITRVAAAIAALRVEPGQSAP